MCHFMFSWSHLVRLVLLKHWRRGNDDQGPSEYDDGEHNYFYDHHSHYHHYCPTTHFDAEPIDWFEKFVVKLPIEGRHNCTNCNRLVHKVNLQ